MAKKEIKEVKKPVIDAGDVKMIDKMIRSPHQAGNLLGEINALYRKYINSKQVTFVSCQTCFGEDSIATQYNRLVDFYYKNK